MAIVVPGQAVNYPNDLIFVPSIIGNDPQEGQGSIAVEVDWSSMGGPDNIVNFNLGALATLPITQVVSMIIDNSECGADITFIFPDTQITMTIPANTPYAVVPVNTRQLQFFLSSPNAEAEDVTRFNILNYLPPPVVIPQPVEQETAVFENISAANGTTALVPNTVDGTVENIDVFFASGSGSGGIGAWKIVDGEGSPVTIAGGTATNGMSGTVYRLSGGRVRFLDGLNFVVSSSALTDGVFSVNINYKVP